MGSKVIKNGTASISKPHIGVSKIVIEKPVCFSLVDEFFKNICGGLVVFLVVELVGKRDLRRDIIFLSFNSTG